MQAHFGTRPSEGRRSVPNDVILFVAAMRPAAGMGKQRVEDERVKKGGYDERRNLDLPSASKMIRETFTKYNDVATVHDRKGAFEHLRKMLEEQHLRWQTALSTSDIVAETLNS